MSVRIRSRAIFSLLVEVEHDELGLVLDFVDAVADLLKKVNVPTCLLERLSNLFIENIGISRLIRLNFAEEFVDLYLLLLILRCEVPALLVEIE